MQLKSVIMICKNKPTLAATNLGQLNCGMTEAIIFCMSFCIMAKMPCEMRQLRVCHVENLEQI